MDHPHLARMEWNKQALQCLCLSHIRSLRMITTEACVQFVSKRLEYEMQVTEKNRLLAELKIIPASYLASVDRTLLEFMIFRNFFKDIAPDLSTL